MKKFDAFFFHHFSQEDGFEKKEFQYDTSSKDGIINFQMIKPAKILNDDPDNLIKDKKIDISSINDDYEFAFDGQNSIPLTLDDGRIIGIIADKNTISYNIPNGIPEVLFFLFIIFNQKAKITTSDNFAKFINNHLKNVLYSVDDTFRIPLMKNLIALNINNSFGGIEEIFKVYLLFKKKYNLKHNEKIKINIAQTAFLYRDKIPAEILKVVIDEFYEEKNVFADLTFDLVHKGDDLDKFGKYVLKGVIESTIKNENIDFDEIVNQINSFIDPPSANSLFTEIPDLINICISHIVREREEEIRRETQINYNNTYFELEYHVKKYEHFYKKILTENSYNEFIKRANEIIKCQVEFRKTRQEHNSERDRNVTIGQIVNYYR